MAWIKCMKPPMNETTLWTNSSPSQSFSAQTVTLSDSILNYSMIRIKGRGKSTSATPKWETYVTPQYLVNCVTTISTAGQACLIACSINSSNGRMGRLVSADSDGLNIIFSATAPMGNSGSGSSDHIVPEEIVGIV